MAATNSTEKITSSSSSLPLSPSLALLRIRIEVTATCNVFTYIRLKPLTLFNVVQWKISVVISRHDTSGLMASMMVSEVWSSFFSLLLSDSSFVSVTSTGQAISTASALHALRRRRRPGESGSCEGTLVWRSVCATPSDCRYPTTKPSQYPRSTPFIEVASAG